MRHFSWLLGFWISVYAIAAVASEPAVQFNRDILPILSDRCFHCHGPDEESREGGFRLDQEESAKGEADSGEPPIVVGDVDASELIRRLTTDDQDERMPPVTSRQKPLTPEQIELFRRWIAEGAEYQPHWAYVAPKDWPEPEVKDAAWPAGWIDRFILTRLEAEGLRPAAEADRVTLIRRLSFDLLGLPPTPEEVQAFVKDQSDDAYERLVDRLLASPRYGERMAMWWLDLVRYADTVGYHGDQDQKTWPYRDYVIRAFSSNLPFDRFTIEQLAGDLVETPEHDQLVATGYNRLLQTSHEGGVQLKEYRAIYQADRIRNFSQVWMGATIGCSQCHNHKYDPYTIHDFYAMGAFFADIDDEAHLRKPHDDLNRLPTRREPEMPYLSPVRRQQIAQKTEQIVVLQQQRAEAAGRLLANQQTWEKTMRAQAEQSVSTDVVLVDDVLYAGGAVSGAWSFVSTDGKPVHSGQKSRRQTAPGIVQHYFHQADKPIHVAGDTTFYAWAYLDPKNPPQAIMLQFNVAGDWSHRAVWGSDAIKFGRRPESWVGYQRQGTLPAAGQWVRLEVPAQQVGLSDGTTVSGMAFTQFAGTVYWDRSGVLLSDQVPSNVAKVFEIPPAERTGQQRELLESYYLQQSPEVQTLDTQIARLTAERTQLTKSAPRTLYTKALKTPRTVRVLPRGNWLDESGEVVQPAIPEFLGKVSSQHDRASRLDLARWLVRPESRGGVALLTARVQANRFWQLLMGVGIARILDDFGGQGELPVHPELLDRLALDFYESGWDVKHLLKTIVMSRTYRQSSVSTPELRKRDPLNRLYACQSRPRLQAEMIRDTALAVSGLLVHELGGPSVKPYQPVGYYSHLNFPVRKYHQHSDARQWRRGLYVHWQRQFLHPMLKAFDAPSREECTAQRSVSNTPTAALAMLNDPTFVEAARVFAVRTLHEGGQTDVQRIVWAFRQAVSRHPQEAEQAVLAELLATHRAYFQAHPKEAQKITSIGLTQAPRDIGSAELAAWTSVSRAILNLNETITRN